MTRITKSSKENLEAIIGLLWEVATDLDTRKPMFARICRSLAEQLQVTLDNHFHSFALDVPRQAKVWHRALLADARIAEEPLCICGVAQIPTPLAR